MKVLFSLLIVASIASSAQAQFPVPQFPYPGTYGYYNSRFNGNRFGSYSYGGYGRRSLTNTRTVTVREPVYIQVPVPVVRKEKAYIYRDSFADYPGLSKYAEDPPQPQLHVFGDHQMVISPRGASGDFKITKHEANDDRKRADLQDVHGKWRPSN